MSEKSNDIARRLVCEYAGCDNLEPLIQAINRTLCELQSLAATTMRDKCVEKVRELYDAWLPQVNDNHSWRQWCNAADFIITALESLTLDQVEQEK